MEKYRTFTDDELLELARGNSAAERKLIMDNIEVIQEIYFRRLHLERGYSSLHEFCVKELKYSDASAARRIKAMRVVAEIPQAKESIASGAMNLSTASQLQRTFEIKAKEKQPLSSDQKVELFQAIQNQSRREVEKTLLEVCPEVVKVPERIRPVSSTQIKIEIVIDGDLYSKIQKLKNLTSHKNSSFVGLLESLVDQELKRKDPELKRKDAGLRQKESEAKNNGSSLVNLGRSGPPTSPSRYIPSTVRHHVWARDRGCCTFMDPVTKRKCESRYKITFEHIRPFSFGGENSLENLRLLCANHNALTARKVFGEGKFDITKRRSH